MIERWLKRAGKEQEGGLSLDDVRKIVAENLARNGNPPGRPAGPGDFPAFLFRKLDTDGDGKLSKEEWEKAGALFNDLDRNNNGSIEPEELTGPRRSSGGAPNGSPASETPAIIPRETKPSAGGEGSS
jgi:hypothetical protein